MPKNANLFKAPTAVSSPASGPSKFSPSVSESVIPLPQHATREAIGKYLIISFIYMGLSAKRGPPQFCTLVGNFYHDKSTHFWANPSAKDPFLEIPGPCHGTRSVGMSKWHGCILLVSPKLLDPGHPWAPQKKTSVARFCSVLGVWLTAS